MYDLPDLLSILSHPPKKIELKKKVKMAITAYWHSIFWYKAAQKQSLQFLHYNYIQLGKSSHPIWSSCPHDSRSSSHSARIHAQLISGSYRCNAVVWKWSGEPPSCRLQGFDSPLGDILHLLSGNCLALRPKLMQTIINRLNPLQPFPFLHQQVISALERPPVAWVLFLLDTSTDPTLIRHVQKFGTTLIIPLFCFSRAYIWAMHRGRLRLPNQTQYLNCQ